MRGEGSVAWEGIIKNSAELNLKWWGELERAVTTGDNIVIF